MNKRKNQQRRKQPRPAPARPDKTPAKAAKPRHSRVNSRATRETVESIVLAVILAFIFRGYEAEAFVIPTGSMASTLMGRHIDVTCQQCGYRYSSGASSENPGSPEPGLVVQTTCPICRYPQTLARAENPDFTGKANPNEDSFNGDRLVVDKVTYLLADPERWDVIVFKYPFNPKQNYIKRLVGLPGETIRIHNGDVFAKQPGASDFEICRKPPYKLRALLQIVDDTNHIPTALIEADGPSRWQQWSKAEVNRLWKIERDENRETYSISDRSDTVAWLGYRHLLPRLTVKDQHSRSATFEWDLPNSDADLQGQLITDFYPYNQNVRLLNASVPIRRAYDEPGFHWAGDLAVECDVVIESESGELLLQLVEGGIKYTCTLDVATGQATLSINDEHSGSDHPVRFITDSGEQLQSLTAETEVRGDGRYHLRFANADDELTLWVDEKVVEFEHPPRFRTPDDLSPRWSETDPLDAEPVRVGSKNCEMIVNRLRLLRDLYCLALKSPGTAVGGIESMDYDPALLPPNTKRLDAMEQEYNELAAEREALLAQPLDSDEKINRLNQIDRQIRELENQLPIVWNEAMEASLQPLRDAISSPGLWSSEAVETLFTTRKDVEFNLKDGQFLPMGDNSPSSKDGRVWGPEHYVEEKWLVGKAQFVFWPHGWRRPIPYWPNFSRFRFVR